MNLATATALSLGLSLYDYTAPQSVPDIIGGDFSDPALAEDGISQGDSNTPAIFNGSAGIVGDKNALAATAGAVDGTSAAYISGTGSVSFNVSGLTANRYYQLAFAAATAAGNQELEVLVDGVSRGSFTPAGTSYSPVSSDQFFITDSGQHTVTIRGLDQTGQASALVDSLHLSLADTAHVQSGGVFVKDGTFEQTAVGLSSSSSPTASTPWQFSGNAGIAGPQTVAYVGSSGQISQSLDGFTDGVRYVVALDAAQSSQTAQTIGIFIDGLQVDAFKPKDGSFRLETSAAFVAGPGSHTLTIRGLGDALAGNATLSNVRILAVGPMTSMTQFQNATFDQGAVGWTTGGDAAIGAPPAGFVLPVGSTAGLLGAGGTIDQTIEGFHQDGAYAVSFRAQSSNAAGINVLVDGNVVSTVRPTGDFQLYASSVFSPGEGVHRVTFQGVGGASVLSDVELIELPASPVGQDSAGKPTLSHTPSQDELQRLQWASAVASVIDSNRSALGGDALDVLTPPPVPAIIGKSTRRPPPPPGNPAAVLYPAAVLGPRTPGIPTAPAALPWFLLDYSKANLGNGFSVNSDWWKQYNVKLTGSTPDPSFPFPKTLAETNGYMSLDENGNLIDGSYTDAEYNSVKTTNLGNNLYQTSYYKRLDTGGWQWVGAEVRDLNNTSVDSRGEVVSQAQLVTNANAIQSAIEITGFSGDNPTQRVIVASTKVFSFPSVGDIFHDLTGEAVEKAITTVLKAAGKIGAGLVEGADPLLTAKSIYDLGSLVTADGTQLYDIQYTFDAQGINPTKIQYTTYAKEEGQLPTSSGASVPASLDGTPYTTTTIYADQQKDPVSGLVLRNPPQIQAMKQFFGVGPDGKTRGTGMTQYFTDGSQIQTAISPNGDVTVTFVDNFGKRTRSTLYTHDGQIQPLDVGLLSFNDTNFDGPNGDANRANYESFLQTDQAALTDFVTGISSQSLKSGFKAAGDLLALSAYGAPISQGQADSIFGNAAWLQQIDQLTHAIRETGLQGAFATAQVGASIVAHSLGYKYAPNVLAKDQPALAASWAKAAAALGDLATLAAPGPGSLAKDARDLQAGVDLVRLASSGEAAIALARVAGIVGDVAGIIQGFEEGGIAGGVQAGFSAAMLGVLLKWAATGSLTVGLVVGLAAVFFGGNHDNLQNMPDKYDTARYGQGVADLQGTAGASGVSFSEDPSWLQLFGGRTGVQAVEETLAQIKSTGIVPGWIQPVYQDLLSKFGYSSNGSGYLQIGDSQGQSVNNQHVENVPGVNGTIYQYLDLDTSLYDFGSRFAVALVAGQAMSFSQLSTPSVANTGGGYGSSTEVGGDDGNPSHVFYA